MPDTKLDLATEVRILRTAMRAVDPEAYIGFVTDAAVRIVATKHDLHVRAVLKAYREKYPLPKNIFSQPFIGGERPSPEAMEVCGKYLLA